MKLKKCPFCRDEKLKSEHKPHVVNLGTGFDKTDGAIFLGYAVTCPFCNCRGPVAGEIHDAKEFWNEMPF